MPRRPRIPGLTKRRGKPVVPATDFRLHLDLPAVFFLEATERIEAGCRKLKRLRQKLAAHDARVKRVQVNKPSGVDHPWGDVILGVGDLEPVFAATMRDFAIADIALVACAEAYANSIAKHVLVGREVEQFDKLGPVGKWLFLPRLLGLKRFRTTLGKEPMQSFCALVARRNRLVHSREISVEGVVAVRAILRQLEVDDVEARKGIQSVRDLIARLCKAWKQTSGPHWVHGNSKRARSHCFYFVNVELGLVLGRTGDRGDEMTD